MASTNSNPADLAGREIIVAVCGGIASYKVADVVSKLVQLGAGVTVCMTREAQKFVAPLTLAVSAAVIGFYLYRSDNYSGFSLGLRWLMWLTPLWLVCLIPIADLLANWRVGRWFTYLCLAVSALSANYSPWNPWRHPWIYDLLVNAGWWSGY